jgi:hypothetical protein
MVKLLMVERLLVLQRDCWFLVRILVLYWDDVMCFETAAVVNESMRVVVRLRKEPAGVKLRLFVLRQKYRRHSESFGAITTSVICTRTYYKATWLFITLEITDILEDWRSLDFDILVTKYFPAS